MKRCAICGERVAYIAHDLCKKCFEKYDKKEPWVKALISIEKHNAYIEYEKQKLIKY